MYSFLHKIFMYVLYMICNTIYGVWTHIQCINYTLVRVSLTAQLVKNLPAMQDLIPGSGRPGGEGIGYPFQYPWASLVAQLVKNPPAMQETWVRSLGWEDPLEKRTATHSSIMAWGIPWTICIQSMGLQRVGHD